MGRQALYVYKPVVSRVMSYVEIEACRLCGNYNLVAVLDLGIHFLSGVFPRTRDETVISGPLELVKCHGENACGLLQLRHSYDPAEMYGDNYGYRSGLNRVMIEHLRKQVLRITQRIDIANGEIVVDIGSNDGTLLQCYPSAFERIGFDPTGEKFRKYYTEDIHLISDFFSAHAYRDEVGSTKAKAVTSIAMLYDLEDPLRFAREIREILADDGVWLTEQSYMPAMIRNVSYDTVCHEHLEYYGLRQIQWIAERSGLRILDVEYNAINGGSFSVMLARDNAPYTSNDLSEDVIESSDSLEPLKEFETVVEGSRDALQKFFYNAMREGKNILGLGASTKGNIILQYCCIGAESMAAIGDVNADKHGCFTPGSRIPILAEGQVLAMQPDYLMVLPWHFRTFFENDAKFAGSRLVFPLPSLSVVNV